MAKGVTRSLHINLLLMHILAATCTDVSLQCDPAEIGTNYSISCSRSDAINTISWISPAGINLFICNKSGTCKGEYPQISTLFNATIENNNNVLKSTLVIYNIRQTSYVNYSCSFDLNNVVTVCKVIEFFTRPEGLNCNDDLKINENYEISITCSLTKVNPAAMMMTSYLNQNKTTNCELDSNSNSVKCQLKIKTESMKIGINFIDLIVYPNVTKGEKYGVNKRLNISLTLPTSSLGQNCLNILNTTQGYIKQGTTVNCTCYVKTQGVPPGCARWFSDDGTEVGSVSSSESSTLQLHFIDKETSYNYRCVGVSHLGKGNEAVEFTIKNAYGPEDIILYNDGSDQFYDICSTNTVINTICSVPRGSVAPEPKIQIMAPDYGGLVITSNHSLTHYIYLSSFRPKRDGFLAVSCEALNSFFNDLRKTADLTVFVAGPPRKPPLIAIGQQNYSGNYGKTVESLKDGSGIDITCQVFGGFPNTYNMTVSCGDSYNNSATNSDVVKLSIENVGRQLNGKLCVCKAEHVTSCYVNNTSSIKLNITFPAAVQTFTVNSNSISLTVSNNSNVIFVCDTESNPPATVEIFKTEIITANTGKMNFTKPMTCEDSGEYFCKAHNSEFLQPNQSSVMLYVKCSLQLSIENENYNFFPAHKGSNAVVKFDVLGFPAPVSYSLFKNEVEYKYIVTNSTSGSSVKYQFEYISNTLPYGRVNVTIFNLTDEDFTNYTLNINNSIDDELKLSFVLIQGNPKEEDDIDILPAAIGGGIGCFALVIVIIIIMFIVEVHHQKLWKKIKSTRYHQYAEQDHQNSDVYIFKSKNGLSMETNYKNYSDVPITITTATALPKNLNVKSKPALMPTYFNTIDDYLNEFSSKEADKSHLIEKEIKKKDSAASYARDISGYQNNESDVYANT